MEFIHVPVMPDEVIDGLNIRPEGIYLDGTAGGGGHSALIAERLTTGRLYSLDRDPEAVEAAGKKLARFGDRVRVIRSNFVNGVEVLRGEGVPAVDGILLDLGVSSHQFDDPDRGFSYRYDSPLDMRMDTGQRVSAKEIVNESSAEELTRIIKEYGEERYAGRIARAIVRSREEKEIRTTGDLTGIIEKTVRMSMRERGTNPSQRTFQALRIAVNSELDNISDSLPGFIEMLSPGGRLCVITFHSLEDRIVKNAMKTAENPCVCPPSFPVCVCGRKSLGKVITRKPIIAGEKELEENPRAHSAKLRIFEKKKLEAD
ncbi:MAG: 16S rRNA (cytosine(1402)-N(4))-methyltransferase RsmH [Lachnospiraceae bacterium]|nr:16S rRNA (cytosine(1402)-N(4))-methyltransferase RsmH [Lachnospiraceae bacterium]